MTSHHRLPVLALLLTILATLAASWTVYVDPELDDAAHGVGSLLSPYASLQKALEVIEAQAEAENTIKVLPGTLDSAVDKLAFYAQPVADYSVLIEAVNTLDVYEEDLRNSLVIATGGTWLTINGPAAISVTVRGFSLSLTNVAVVSSGTDGVLHSLTLDNVGIRKAPGRALSLTDCIFRGSDLDVLVSSGKSTFYLSSRTQAMVNDVIIRDATAESSVYLLAHSSFVGNSMYFVDCKASIAVVYGTKDTTFVDLRKIRFSAGNNPLRAAAGAVINLADIDFYGIGASSPYIYATGAGTQILASGVSVSGSSAAACHGVIHNVGTSANPALVVVENLHIFDSFDTTSSCGAVVSESYSTTYMRDSRIQGYSSTRSAVYVDSLARLKMTHSVLDHNVNTGNGGGLYVDGGHASLHDVLITQNKAATGGGVFVTIPENLLLSEVVITDNESTTASANMHCSVAGVLDASSTTICNKVGAHNNFHTNCDLGAPDPRIADVCACDAESTCSTCTAQPTGSCGWDEENGECLAGVHFLSSLAPSRPTQTGLAPLAPTFPSEAGQASWFTADSQCIGTAPDSCETHASCGPCTADTDCGWCGTTKKCLTAPSADSTDIPSECPVPFSGCTDLANGSCQIAGSYTYDTCMDTCVLGGLEEENCHGSSPYNAHRIPFVESELVLAGASTVSFSSGTAEIDLTAGGMADFEWYGTTLSSIHIHQHGYLVMDSVDVEYGPSLRGQIPLSPDFELPRNVLAFAWGDFSSATTAEILFSTGTFNVLQVVFNGVYTVDATTGVSVGVRISTDPERRVEIHVESLDVGSTLPQAPVALTNPSAPLMAEIHVDSTVGGGDGVEATVVVAAAGNFFEAGSHAFAIVPCGFSSSTGFSRAACEATHHTCATPAGHTICGIACDPSTVDACGICGGDGSSCADCDGVSNGLSFIDLCGNCNDNDNACILCDWGSAGGTALTAHEYSPSECDPAGCFHMDDIRSGAVCQDCFGNLNSSIVVDDCSVCGGENESCNDCAGVANGGATLDACGVCNGDGESCKDCMGVLFGPALYDACGECGGTCDCLDCFGVVNGTAVLDLCGVCDGDSDTCFDCSGVANGSDALNACGTCGSTPAALSCLGCDGIAWSGKEDDECGDCDGGNAACMDCSGVPNGDGDFDQCGVCRGDNSTCVDCAGAIYGNATRDDCGVCEGSSDTCLDERGVPNGTAFMGPCGEVVDDGDIWIQSPADSGNWIVDTSRDPGFCNDCGGVPNGDLVVDLCLVCGGDNTACADCDGVVNGPSTYDDCGVCKGTNSTCLDARGNPNGTAVWGPCGVIRDEDKLWIEEPPSSGTFVEYTDKPYAFCEDCGGIANGTLANDECGVCGGDDSSCTGCDGVLHSGLVWDECGVCNGGGVSCSDECFGVLDDCGVCDGSNDCIGCDGVLDSGKKMDGCGVCGGGNFSCGDCNGVAYGTDVLDICNVCGGDGTSCYDCKGVKNGPARVDACGVCGGDGSTCRDCLNIAAGTLEFDDCGVCGGDNSTCTDCLGVLHGDAVVDLCGECDGDNSSCKDCGGVINGKFVKDECGVCEGDGSSCGDCFGVAFGDAVIDACGICNGGNVDFCGTENSTSIASSSSLQFGSVNTAGSAAVTAGFPLLLLILIIIFIILLRKELSGRKEKKPRKNNSRTMETSMYEMDPVHVTDASASEAKDTQNATTVGATMSIAGGADDDAW